MKLKTVTIDGKVYAEVQDDKPIFIADDGVESAVDVPGTTATIARINQEAKTHRLGKEAAEKALKAFEGIADPTAALKALEITANLDAKKLIDAGEAQRVRDEITKGYADKLTAADQKYTALEKSFHDSEVGGAFARSKYIADKIAVPADMLKAAFGSHFKLEDGKLAVHDAQGNRIVSKARPGEYADFEEGLETLVSGYAYRDNILKGNSNGGSGARQGNGAGGAKTITRAAFDALSPASQQSAIITDKVTVTD